MTTLGPSNGDLGRPEIDVAIPHRSVEAPSGRDVAVAAALAEDLGFGGVWVSENTLNTDKPDVACLDPVTALSFAAAVTSEVRLGLAVAILNVHQPFHLAHQWASLDHLSGGRAVLGVGIGRPFNYREFGVDEVDKAQRFEESIHLLRRLWTGEPVDYRGDYVASAGSRLAQTPVGGTLPIMIGGTHPNALERAVRIGDGWIAPGAGALHELRDQIEQLRHAAASHGRDLSNFPIVKRIHVAVEDGTGTPTRQLKAWFEEVYRMPDGVENGGLVGSAEAVAAGVRSLIDQGVTRVVLNPVADFQKQLPALAEVASEVGAA